MSATTYDDLAAHVGHAIHCVAYGAGENVAVECADCSVVLIDFDRRLTDGSTITVEPAGGELGDCPDWLRSVLLGEDGES